MDTTATKGIYDKMVSEKLVVSMTGLFGQEQLLSLLPITDKKLTGLEVSPSVKKRIFHFMLEYSSNLLNIERNRHSHKNIFLIGHDGDKYTVYLGSAVSKMRLNPVLKTITEVNTIDMDDIKGRYYNELASPNAGDHNLLFLSMLGISRKTKKKIDYDTVDIDDQTAFLSFKVAMAN